MALYVTAKGRMVIATGVRYPLATQLRKYLGILECWCLKKPAGTSVFNERAHPIKVFKININPGNSTPVFKFYKQV